jgi:hypothetical protein
MSDYMVHTEVNHFEGWLGNEHDLNTLEEARAEMLRQEKVIRAEIEDGLYVMGEPAHYFIVRLCDGAEEVERITWADDATRKRMKALEDMKGVRP